MKKVTLFIAISVDGYIADQYGNVDWLAGQEPDKDDMESYDVFIKDIDTVIMGWNTYNQIVTELSPDNWMYSGMDSYVLTHRELPNEEEITFTGEDICGLVKKLKKTSGKDIWICGGAQTAAPLLAENLIDRYHLSVIPVILGKGIRLFENETGGIPLKLIQTKNYNGITDLVYEKRAHASDRRSE